MVSPFYVTQDPVFAAAHLSILHTMSKYFIDLDAGDFESFREVYAPDGVFETTANGTFIGPDAICAELSRRREGRTKGYTPDTISQQHNLTSCQIDLIDETHARATSYFLITSEIGLDHTGYYRDEFRLVDGRWLIARRCAKVTWIADNSRFGPGIGIH